MSAKETDNTRKQALGVSDQAMVAALQGGGYGIREIAGIASDAANTAQKTTNTVTKGVSDGAKKSRRRHQKGG